MKCSVCGSELPENSKFCIFCGSTLKTAAPETPTYAPPSYTPPAQPEQPAYNPAGYNSQNSLYQQPTYNPPVYTPPAPPTVPPVPVDTRETVVVPAKPVTKSKKGGKKWIAVTAIIAAVLAVVVIAGIVILNIPSVKVPMALSRSMNAYTGIADDIGFTKALAFLEDEASTESLTLTFEGINSMIADAAAADGVDLSQFETLGVRFDSSTSLAERRMSGSFALVYEGSDLIKANLGVDNDTVWVAVPDLISGKYGIKTSTLGRDLVEMGAVENGTGIESLGFNIFDLIELMKTLEPSEDIAKELEAAAKELDKALEIEADGSDEIKVNGKRINCSLYDVTIPQDALEDYLDAIEDPMNDYMDQYMDVIFELFESIGMPEDILDEMKYEMSPAIDMGMYIDALKEALDYIGDVELEVYLKGGYVMAVIYELEVDGETMVITANMGGDGKYVDDFSLTVEMEDYFTFELSSSGNHTGKGGEFTDKTELEITVDGERSTIALESSYAPKAKEDNFQCELTISEIFFGVPTSVEAEGQLTLEKNKLHMKLDELSVAVAGMDMVTLGVDYSIGEYTGAESGSVKYINKLTEDDLMAMSEELMTNAQAFAEDLVEKVPFIQAILNAQVPAYPEEVYPSDGYYYG